MTRGWGSLAHIAFGFLAALLGETWLFTIVFLIKQGLDVHAGEDPAETSWDITCYAIGLVLGMLVRKVV